MTPVHHEERLCAWAEKTGRPVLSIDYGKAPECEYSLRLFTSTLPPTFPTSNRSFCLGDAGGAVGRRATHWGQLFYGERLDGS